MPQFPAWNPALSVGNRKLDEQHQELLDLCGKIIESFNSPARESEEFHHLLNDLAELVSSHLTLEEAILARNGYPGLASHQEEHSIYLEQLSDILFQSMLKQVDQSRFRRMVDDFANHHLRRTDLNCKEFMRE